MFHELKKKEKAFKRDYLKNKRSSIKGGQKKKKIPKNNGT